MDNSWQAQKSNWGDHSSQWRPSRCRCHCSHEHWSLPVDQQSPQSQHFPASLAETPRRPSTLHCHSEHRQCSGAGHWDKLMTTWDYWCPPPSIGLWPSCCLNRLITAMVQKGRQAGTGLYLRNKRSPKNVNKVCPNQLCQPSLPQLSTNIVRVKLL